MKIKKISLLGALIISSMLISTFLYTKASAKITTSCAPASPRSCATLMNKEGGSCEIYGDKATITIELLSRTSENK